MDTQKTRFTLDMDSAFQRKLKVMATLKGMTMRQYCLQAIERELERDEANGVRSLPFGKAALNRLRALQAEAFGDQQMPEDSAELVRETRAARDKTR